MSDNHLDETSDTILPINNALGLPSDFIGEIVREFDRACESKNISGEMLQRFLDNKKSWRIQAITIGCVSNVIIRNGFEGESLIPQLNQLGNDLVMSEIITMALSEKGSKAISRKNNTKRGPTKAVTGIRNGSPKNAPLPKSSSHTVTFALVGVVVLAIALISFVLISDTDKSDNADQPPLASSSVLDKASQSKMIDEEKVGLTIIKETEVPKPKPVIVPEVKKIVAEGMAVYQKGQDSFIGGNIYSYSFTKKNGRSPYHISGEKNTQFSVIKFDLNNLPSSSVVERAVLKVNFLVLSKKADAVNIYCLPSTYKFDLKTSDYRRSALGVKWSYEDFLGLRSVAKKGLLTMQQDWVTFDVTQSIKDIVVDQSTNNGLILFTDTEARLMFSGFNSVRVLSSPKLMITFKEKVAVEAKPVAKPIVKEYSPKTTKKIVEKTTKDTSEDDNAFEEEEPAAKAKFGDEEDKLDEAIGDMLKPGDIEEEPVAFSVKPPVIVSVDRLILDRDLVYIENIPSKGKLRYSINKEISFETSKVYTSPITLVTKGLNTLNAAIFFEGKMISEISRGVFFKTFLNKEVFVDNHTRSCKKIGGKWEKSKTQKGYQGSNYLMSTKKGSKVHWTPLIKTKGFYDIYASLPKGNLTRPKTCHYSIHSKGSSVKMNTVDQSLLRPQWAYLGRYQLNKGKGHYVELIAESSSKITIADAMIFVKVEKKPSLGAKK